MATKERIDYLVFPNDNGTATTDDMYVQVSEHNKAMRNTSLSNYHDGVRDGAVAGAMMCLGLTILVANLYAAAMTRSEGIKSKCKKFGGKVKNVFTGKKKKESEDEGV